MSYNQPPPAQPPIPGQAPFGPPPGQPWPSKPKWARKRVAIPAALVILFFGVGIGSSDSESTQKANAASKPQPTVTVTKTAEAAIGTTKKAEPQPTVTVTKTKTAKPTKKPEPKVATIPGEGTFVVGSDIKPGTYKTAGAEESVIPNCYWARLKGTSGTFKDIIANSNSEGPTTVTISSSDGAFKTNGCKTWKKVG
ncbi:hypothetical protein ABT119_05795 [Streptomyces sp. NPDC001910]|uniref:hypothetical protein n=1 Tax=Streptomyces sp. NPDC001910 TaxID=3154403 RepID=UPI0033172F7B